MKKMRIPAVALIATLAVASCAKERTCECEDKTTSRTTTANGTTENTSDPQTSTRTFKKIKKSEFKLYCTDASYESTQKLNQNGDEVTYYYKSETTCEIK